ncbi:glyoxalase [Alteribacter lacisalsi]|uniref:Glyoxalase n=1 Tax=Alteribacter lacisalsi TaxID=2045244 RepID=A0A2W0H2U3_9BACI|nr:VOC family protein [Alteribacter lacisalsi]PYZ95537.1 glyoxalase [Alteribacter lacisalsi]
MSRFHQAPAVFASGLRLKTGDLNRAVSFYTTVLGFQAEEEREGVVQLLVPGGGQPFLTIEEGQGVTPRRPYETGLFHFAILLPERADLGRFIRYMTERGVPLHGASDHDVSEAVYFSDPDGNGIEVYTDRGADEWKWEGGSVYMTSEPLDIKGLMEAAENTTWSGLPQGTELGHIHMQAADLPASERFYKEGLGLDLVCRFGRDALFLSSSGYHHHIGLNTWNSRGAKAPAASSAGIRWFDLAFPNEEKRTAAVERLDNLGFDIVKREGHYAVKDPSKNLIRLITL